MPTQKKSLVGRTTHIIKYKSQKSFYSTVHRLIKFNFLVAKIHSKINIRECRCMCIVYVQQEYSINNLKL